LLQGCPNEQYSSNKEALVSMDIMTYIFTTTNPGENYVLTVIICAVAASIANILLLRAGKAKALNREKKYPQAQIVSFNKKSVFMLDLVALFSILLIAALAFALLVFGYAVRLVWLIYFAFMCSGIPTLPFKIWEMVVAEDALFITNNFGKKQKVLYTDISEVLITAPEKDSTHNDVQIFSHEKKVASLNTGYQGYEHLYEKLKALGLV